jgi:hypothetical protein
MAEAQVSMAGLEAAAIKYVEEMLASYPDVDRHSSQLSEDELGSRIEAIAGIAMRLSQVPTGREVFLICADTPELWEINPGIGPLLGDARAAIMEHLEDHANAWLDRRYASA